MQLPIFKLEENFPGISRNKRVGILKLIRMPAGTRPIAFDFRTPVRKTLEGPF